MAPVPTPLPATAERMAKLEDGLNEERLSSIPDLNDNVDLVSKELERIYRELVETNRRVTSLDRYASTERVNELRTRLEQHLCEWTELHGQDEHDKTASLRPLEQERLLFHTLLLCPRN